MIFWVITAIIITIVACNAIWQWVQWDWQEGVVALITGAVVGTLCWGLFALLVAGGIASFTGKTVEAQRFDTQLAALNTGNQVTGRFFLGSGMVKSGQTFTFVYDRGDGGYVLSEVPARDSVVYEDEQSNPHMTTIKYETEPNEFWAPFAIMQNRGVDYEFHIPEGSVLTGNYEVAP